jgi:hypothetical protein
MTSVRDEYAVLMMAFVDGSMSAAEFERRYLEKFKADRRQLDEATFAVLDEVFGEVDAFCADEQVYEQIAAEHPGWPNSAVELREKVRAAITRLTGLT